MNVLRSRSLFQISRLLPRYKHVADRFTPAPTSRYHSQSAQWRNGLLGSIPALTRHYNTSLRRPSTYFHSPSFDRVWCTAVAVVAGIGIYNNHLETLPYPIQTVPYTNRAHSVDTSPWKARAAAELAFAEFKKQHASAILDPLHPCSARVRDITEEVVLAVRRGLAIRSKKHGTEKPYARHLHALRWEAIVVRDEQINAGCYPGGGKIIVSQGLIDNFETDAEVATVIAHEVAHTVARHASEMPAFLDERRNEIEADHIGIMLLAAAGFDPHIAPKVWDKCAKLYPCTTLENDASIHPPDEKRSQYLSQPEVMEEALELYREVTADRRKNI